MDNDDPPGRKRKPSKSHSPDPDRTPTKFREDTDAQDYSKGCTPISKEHLLKLFNAKSKQPSPSNPDQSQPTDPFAALRRAQGPRPPRPRVPQPNASGSSSSDQMSFAETISQNPEAASDGPQLNPKFENEGAAERAQRLQRLASEIMTGPRQSSEESETPDDESVNRYACSQSSDTTSSFKTQLSYPMSRIDETVQEGGEVERDDEMEVEEGGKEDGERDDLEDNKKDDEMEVDEGQNGEEVL